MVNHGERSGVECGPVAKENGEVVGLLVYITQNGSLSSCCPIAIANLLWLGIFSKEVTTSLAAFLSQSFPLIFGCPLILCTFVWSPRFAL